MNKITNLLTAFSIVATAFGCTGKSSTVKFNNAKTKSVETRQASNEIGFRPVDLEKSNHIDTIYIDETINNKPSPIFQLKR